MHGLRCLKISAIRILIWKQLSLSMTSRTWMWQIAPSKNFRKAGFTILQLGILAFLLSSWTFCEQNPRTWSRIALRTRYVYKNFLDMAFKIVYQGYFIYIFIISFMLSECQLWKMYMACTKKKILFSWFYEQFFIWYKYI